MINIEIFLVMSKLKHQEVSRFKNDILHQLGFELKYPACIHFTGYNTELHNYVVIFIEILKC